jgi:DNA-binding MltR family transcriptional regulator
MKKDKLDLMDYNSMVEFYQKESDRAAAILAASFLEAYLAQFLKKFMINDQQLCDNLLNGFGPLATFSARIKCAYAFGYIDEETRNNLNYIRKIRNEFAHNHELNSFADSPIPDLCQNLSMSASLEGISRLQYIWAISIIVGKLHHKIEKLKKAKA